MINTMALLDKESDSRIRGLPTTIQTQDNRKRKVKDDIAGHKDGKGCNIRQKKPSEISYIYNII